MKKSTDKICYFEVYFAQPLPLLKQDRALIRRAEWAKLMIRVSDRLIHPPYSFPHGQDNKASTESDELCIPRRSVVHDFCCIVSGRAKLSSG